MITKALYSKLRVGDPINDEELDDALEYYSNIKAAIEAAEYIPPEYKLFMTDVHSKVMQLESYKKARAEGKRASNEITLL